MEGGVYILLLKGLAGDRTLSRSSVCCMLLIWGIPQVVVEGEKAMEVEDLCEGIGEDECLMRRTLAAHTDYLYTQKHKH